MSQADREDLEANNLYWLAEYCWSVADEPTELCAVAPQFHIPWELRSDGIGAIDRVLDNSIKAVSPDLRSKLQRLKGLLSGLPPAFVSEALASREQCVNCLQSDPWQKVVFFAVPLAPELLALSGIPSPRHPLANHPVDP